jgi:hypothetical protein
MIEAFQKLQHLQMMVVKGQDSSFLEILDSIHTISCDSSYFPIYPFRIAGFVPQMSFKSQQRFNSAE